MNVNKKPLKTTWPHCKANSKTNAEVYPNVDKRTEGGIDRQTGIIDP